MAASEAARHDVTVTIRSGGSKSLQDGRHATASCRFSNWETTTACRADRHAHPSDRPATDTADLKIFLHRAAARSSWDQAKKMPPRRLGAGFTTVRNVGTYIAWTDRDLRDAINQGKAIGPAHADRGLLPDDTGRAVGPRYRRAGKDIPAIVRMGVAHNGRGIRAKAQEAIDGARSAEVIASGAVLATRCTGRTGDDPEEIAAVAAVAHAAGRKLAAHAHGAQSNKQAILAGADTIEHASYINDEDIRSPRRTTSPCRWNVYNGGLHRHRRAAAALPAEFLRKNIETTEVQRQGFTHALAAV